MSAPKRRNLDDWEAERGMVTSSAVAPKSKFDAWREQQAAQPDTLTGSTYPDDIMRRAREAAERLLSGHSYQDWLIVGAAYQQLQSEALHRAGTNEAEGKRYNQQIKQLLDDAGLGIVLKDRGVRSRLLDLVKHREEVERFRANLKPGRRLQLNHPNSVWRAWQKSLPHDPDAPQPEAKPTLAQRLAEVLEENHRLKQEIERGGGDLWAPKDTAAQIARAVIDRLTSSKAEKVARAMLKLAADKKKREDEVRGAKPAPSPRAECRRAKS
jgi:hypothetical protein